MQLWDPPGTCQHTSCPPLISERALCFVRLASGRCKVADFGLSKEFVSSGNTYGGVGTLAWSAPETFDGIFNERSDVFSFAIVMYELATRIMPYAGVSRNEIDAKVKERFRFSQRALEKRSWGMEEQMEIWRDDNPIEDRRPDLTRVEAGCPEIFCATMQACWVRTRCPCCCQGLWWLCSCAVLSCGRARPRLCVHLFCFVCTHLVGRAGRCFRSPPQL